MGTNKPIVMLTLGSLHDTFALTPNRILMYAGKDERTLIIMLFPPMAKLSSILFSTLVQLKLYRAGVRVGEVHIDKSGQPSKSCKPHPLLQIFLDRKDESMQKRISSDGQPHSRLNLG